MDFFNVYVNLDNSDQESKFIEYLSNMEHDLHKGDLQNKLYHLPDGTWLLKTWSDVLSSVTIVEKLSCALAGFIVDVKERDILKVLITKRYSFEDIGDHEAVERFCNRLLNTGSDGSPSREAHIQTIQRNLSQFISETGSVHLNGFVTFRLREYEDKLQEIVDYAVEEYLLDQQYEEFIGLLQYFVYFQEPLTPLVHLLHKGDQEFSILNEQFTPIKAPPISGVVARMADQELEMEDVVVSTLIALSPVRVLIHTLEPDALIISTICRIFGERVELCSHCPKCNLFHHHVRQRDQGT